MPETSRNGWQTLTPAERTAKAQVAALSRPGGADRTAAARQAYFQREFYDKTDPALSDDARMAAALQLRRAHLSGLRLKSLTKARHAREAAEAAAAADAELADAETQAQAGGQ